MPPKINDLADLQEVCKLEHPELAKALDKSKSFVDDLKIIRLFLVKNLGKSESFVVRSYLNYIDSLVNISAAVESSVRAGNPASVPLPFFDDLSKSASQVVFDAKEMNKKLEMREMTPIITSPNFILDLIVGLNGFYYKVPKAQKAGDPRAAEYEVHYKKILAKSLNALSEQIRKNLRSLTIPGDERGSARLREMLLTEAAVLKDVSAGIQKNEISSPQLVASIFGGIFLTWLWLAFFPITFAAGIPRPRTMIVAACSILARRISRQ